MFSLPAPNGRKGGVFYCTCGFSTVKRPIHDNGNRRCPVCSNDLAYHESVSLLADHYSCDHCIEVIEKRLNREPFLAEHLERSYRGDHHPGNLVFVTVLVLLILLVSTLGAAFMAHAATEKIIEVELRPDQAFSDVTIRQELGEERDREPTTTISLWRDDLGQDFPNGTFYGTLLAGSAFEHRFRPYWLPKDDLARTGRFSYVMLSAHFNWSSQIIMSGCSEWWLKVPVLASSIEWSYGLYIAVFKDVTDLGSVQFDNRSFYNNKIYVRPSSGGLVPDDLVSYYAPNYTDHIGDPLTEGSGDLNVVGENVYVKVHSILRPERDYVISIYFRLPMEGKLKTLWSGSEIPAGGSTRICFGDYQIVDNFSPGNRTYFQNLTGQDIIDLELDLDWSFLFTEGVGEGNLFGLKVPIHNGTIITLYPVLNTTVEDSEDGLIHPSFMLPWISDDVFNMSFGVANMQDEGVIGVQHWHHWQFEPDPPDPVSGTFYWIADQAWDYVDFALFSTNWTLDFDNIDYPFNATDRYNVAVDFYFYNEGNLTLLCYDQEREDLDWSAVDPFETNQTEWPFARNSIWDTENLSQVLLEYGVYCSAYGTYGQWAQRSQTPSGKSIWTHYFPNKIFLSAAEWRISRGEDRNVTVSPAEQAWSEAQDLWGEGHYIKAIGMALKSAVMFIWEGADKIRGWITDGLTWVWEGMKSLGQWLYTNLVSFFEKIISFLEDAADLLVDMWDVMKYLVSPILLMALYGGSIRVTRTWLKKGLEPEKRKGKAAGGAS